MRQRPTSLPRICAERYHRFIWCMARPLQAQGSADAIRAAARRSVATVSGNVTVETGFGWDTLPAASGPTCPVRRSAVNCERATPSRVMPAPGAEQSTRRDRRRMPYCPITAGKLDWSAQKTLQFLPWIARGRLGGVCAVGFAAIAGLDSKSACGRGA
ncbi:MAG: hypothetical protein IPL59_08455 [Candidatus Competibacteraceae bacterium]|nr:hypothetical protein [Candidatus Competibacteraceae bacterium]